MRISELIKILQNWEKEKGDLYVVIQDYDNWIKEPRIVEYDKNTILIKD
jgi:hypothetical protein